MLSGLNQIKIFQDKYIYDFFYVITYPIGTLLGWIQGVVILTSGSTTAI